MTSTTSEIRPADLGTLVVLAWSGEAPDGSDMPYLLAYSLGDAEGGPDATAAAVEQLLASNGLPVGGELVDGNAKPSLPVRLLVEAGQAVVQMPQLVAQADAPEEWLAAVADRGYAYLVFTTRAWPEGEPGKVVEPATLAAFAGAEETLNAAAHIVLPATSLRG
ncbi:hypothetical protein LK07_11410 [Streptomyces pluripotens]|uniref:Uncharacterized protein n=1 Tax=Streptomyces pluripotens TaxID=1355015 RepID=A0A221NXJ7_9ACTN|nr:MULTISPECIES: DUF5949 family protein [Streptomyces]ARP70289.1 hypothetical protein LK06_010285 [Streptomyces pluripotens]ASN24546.1 hypothetical protein LK07_11410 [Streptomyces pluripotens]KIE28066.1 hypothetical protein LK08_05190 [Streptomyces sp. MUSC 125]MCH0558390.1 hypothetical protein [Streptomyces sp. MUM 16J]